MARILWNQYLSTGKGNSMKPEKTISAIDYNFDLACSYPGFDRGQDTKFLTYNGAIYLCNSFGKKDLDARRPILMALLEEHIKPKPPVPNMLAASLQVEQQERGKASGQLEQYKQIVSALGSQVILSMNSNLSGVSGKIDTIQKTVGGVSGKVDTIEKTVGNQMVVFKSVAKVAATNSTTVKRNSEFLESKNENQTFVIRDLNQKRDQAIKEAFKSKDESIRFQGLYRKACKDNVRLLAECTALENENKRLKVDDTNRYEKLLSVVKGIAKDDNDRHEKLLSIVEGIAKSLC